MNRNGMGATVAVALAQQRATAYAILWLRPGAPDDIVRAAYRVLARTHHPDVGGDPERMVQINAAYAVLSAKSR